jgi:membrane protein implicated in regulation of membrane protease activity
MNRFLQLFLNYGLVAAILVWAATVALMAYHLKDSPWRWAFILLSLAGLGTVWAIFQIRKYVKRVTKEQREVGKVQ